MNLVQDVGKKGKSLFPLGWGVGGWVGVGGWRKKQELVVMVALCDWMVIGKRL